MSGTPMPSMPVLLRQMAQTIARNFVAGNFAGLSEAARKDLMDISLRLDEAADAELERHYFSRAPRR